MTVRLLPQAGSGIRHQGSAIEPDCESGERETGTAYLRARARVARIPGFDPVLDAVRGWVRDQRVERREPVTTVYHLIPRSAAAAYRSAVERAAASAGIRLVVSGPFPPYAFSTPL
jgi:hypothetical protein